MLFCMKRRLMAAALTIFFGRGRKYFKTREEPLRGNWLCALRNWRRKQGQIQPARQLPLKPDFWRFARSTARKSCLILSKKPEQSDSRRVLRHITKRANPAGLAKSTWRSKIIPRAAVSRGSGRFEVKSEEEQRQWIQNP